MQDIEFWRTVIYHPLSVHFPIVLILLAAFFKLLSLFKTKFTSTTRILIFLAAVTTWIAYYTGSLADGEVSRQLCDPTILKTHENFALYLGYIISVAAAIELIVMLNLIKITKKLYCGLSLTLLLIACSGVIYVGHLGAELVYNQAAGVYIPTEDCREFE